LKKSLLYLTGKNMPRLSFILLLIASMGLVGVSANTGTTISLNPAVIEVSAPGEWFTVDVNIADVPDLQGYEFKLWFNTTLLNATEVIPSPINPPDTMYGPGKMVDSKYIWAPLQNFTDGFVWVVAAFPLGSPFTGGDGTIMTINFTALAIGDCNLHLNETVLGNSSGEAIDHELLDGSVTVVPEFPLAVAMPLLLIATLAVTLLGKMFWARKRKDAPTKRERRR
jgi:hypothetical protein